MLDASDVRADPGRCGVLDTEAAQNPGGLRMTTPRTDQIEPAPLRAEHKLEPASNTSTPPPTDLVDQKLAAALAEVSISTIARWRRQRSIGTWRRGRRVLVSRSEVCNFAGPVSEHRPGDH
jgi:hypothetical protein